MGSLREGFYQALSWIRSNNNEKFFMFIQGYDVHPPFNHVDGYKKQFEKDYTGALLGKELNYQLLKNIRNFHLNMDGKDVLLTQNDINYVIAAYDEGVRLTDKLFGDFIRSLKELGKLDDTIIILFSDHGEELHDVPAENVAVKRKRIGEAGNCTLEGNVAATMHIEAQFRINGNRRCGAAYPSELIGNGKVRKPERGEQ